MTRNRVPTHGVYIMDKGAPVTGVAYGDYLLIRIGAEHPYLLCRPLTCQEAEKILAADGCRYLRLPASYTASSRAGRPHLEIVR